MDMSSDLCDNLAAILKGKGNIENVVCSITHDRKDIKASIAGKSLHSLHDMFNFETPDSSGASLITGEMVLLEEEVYKTVNALSNSGIDVSAVHNHWLFDTPKLMYIHMEAIMNPVEFAKKVAPLIGG